MLTLILWSILMQLSNNFELSEFTQSPTAKRYHIQLNPNQRVQENLKALAENVLQPIRDKWGAVKISSGYRSVLLNSKIKGAATNSQHLCKGGNSAADIKFPGQSWKMLKKVFAWIVLESGIEYDQIILYNRWIHISYDRGDTQQKNAFRHRKWKKKRYFLLNNTQVKKWYAK